ncbi:protein of unknown function [Vibrio tapetis subsp. tapetis]|uniref:Uncharacterized protein n=1 Tax=Vibrio tapetis subsp. tapetis TaxID=1671868 RepID=A0A2N8ZHS2_9VIBR|nr:protein of unknown function [Vibrio tapetis subsp. tapetis]
MTALYFHNYTLLKQLRTSLKSQENLLSFFLKSFNNKVVSNEPYFLPDLKKKKDGLGHK